MYFISIFYRQVLVPITATNIVFFADVGKKWTFFVRRGDEKKKGAAMRPFNLDCCFVSIESHSFHSSNLHTKPPCDTSH